MFTPELLNLAIDVLATARREGLRLATAESCTGGLIAALLSEIPGSSDVLTAGLVTYANDAKESFLGVNPETLAQHGAVSEAVAREMALGAVARSHVQLGVAVTGIAGPGGGSALKPVGLVHIAALRIGRAVTHEEHRFGDIGRSEIRLATVDAGLRLLLKLM
jgi:nicotinamide-nucleotide amidase